jgi:hypothetical protein
MAAKLSAIVRGIEWSSKLKVLRTEIYTRPHREGPPVSVIVLRMADGTDRYAESPVDVEIDWTPPSPEQAAHYRAVYEYHR